MITLSLTPEEAKVLGDALMRYMQMLADSHSENREREMHFLASVAKKAIEAIHQVEVQG